MTEPELPQREPAHVESSREKWGTSTLALLVSSAVTLGILAIAFFLPVPFVKLAPGPTFNVIGDVDGAPVIQINGAPTFPTTGELDMTTVRESGGPRGGLTFVDAVGSWFNSSDAVVPRELVYPDDISGEDVKARNAALFSTSESDSVAAALNYLELPVQTKIVATAVIVDAPADEVFLPRDEIVSIDGVPVTTPRDVVQTVQGSPVGTEFTFEIRRSAENMSVTVASGENPDAPGKPYLGISVGELYSAEFDIDFTLSDVGGPSAGLMFATGIVDKLTPEDLTGGKHVAGTGTITPEGAVGPIGGIRQKLAGARSAGAELFLMPEQHCAESQGHIPDGLTVTPVTSLRDAIKEMSHWVAGMPVTSCPKTP
ncbi:MAG: PDZ domain-containing protein [Actinomycetia bacterium]|nr:PDZ domain-containing protein [Actinomycetes bacterium]